jgi:hypothetical protein
VKRTFLLLLLVLGFAVVAGSQTASAPVQFSAMTMSRDATTHRLRGSVRFVTGSVVITADEADAPVTGQFPPTEFDLRGHVHLSTAAASK